MRFLHIAYGRRSTANVHNRENKHLFTLQSTAVKRLYAADVRDALSRLLLNVSQSRINTILPKTLPSRSN